MKPKLLDSRFDFRGGLNTVTSPELLNANELRVATNARFMTTGGIGAVGNRTGSRRLHAEALAAGRAITGLTQWDAPAGKQLVAVAGGKLYHRIGDEGEFAEVQPSPAFSSTAPQSFAVFRGDGQSAALQLFIADGTVVYSWDGQQLTRRDGVNGFPRASLLAPYHVRLFANSSEYLKHLFWSKLGDATDYTVGVGTAGGAAMIGVLTGEQINALQPLGSSLLVCGPDSIARYTGYSDADIRIEQDTEGLSSALGVVGPQAIAALERTAAALTDLGPYLVTESELLPIGTRIEDRFDALDRTRLQYSAVAFHKGRREIWFAVPGRSNVLYCFNLRLQSWTGPWEYPFDIYTLSPYEDAFGDEYVIAGGADGYIRHMDHGVRDDVLSSGLGGSAYSWHVEFAPVFFDTGPGVLKQLQRAALQLSLPAGEQLTWRVYADSLPPVDYVVDGASVQPTHYRVDLSPQGARFRFAVLGSHADIAQLHGFVLYAWDMQRPA